MKVLPKVIIPTMLASDSSGYTSFKDIYNSRVIFTPLSTIPPCNQEHSETNPIFCNIAKNNSIEEWQVAGIPPIICAKHNNDNFFILLQVLAPHVIIP